MHKNVRDLFNIQAYKYIHTYLYITAACVHKLHFCIYMIAYIKKKDIVIKLSYRSI